MIKDNVIELPIKNRLLKVKNTLRLRFDLEQRKVLASASILSILFIVAVVNDNLMAKRGSAELSSRSIASVDGSLTQARPDFAWESQLAQQLAQEDPKEREALLAAKPSKIDQLSYGELEGKYSLEVFRGHIRGLEFAQAGSDPTLIQDRVQLLNHMRELLPVSFQTAALTSSHLDNGDVVEQFALKGATNTAKVEFRLDSFGRLLSMKVTE